MGYVFDFKDAMAYEEWLNQPRNKTAMDLEVRLMLKLLSPARGESVLDIGCGTGASLLPFLETGVSITGLDPSIYMLDIAYKKVKNRVDLYRGYAEDLPFDDNSFNHASFMTTLEFVEDHRKAIEEACRVAKDRVFIGILNPYAIKCIQMRIKGFFTQTIFNYAHFYSIWELKQVIRDTLGDVPLAWRTVSLFPSATGGLAHKIEESHLVQRCPFGAFAGIVITLVPRFRTRPLVLTYKPGHTAGSVAGLAGNMHFKENGLSRQSWKRDK
jgi:SAM-dependent methyltransferase